jgi:hypothetical protein
VRLDVQFLGGDAQFGEVTFRTSLKLRLTSLKLTRLKLRFTDLKLRFTRLTPTLTDSVRNIVSEAPVRAPAGLDKASAAL